MSKYSILAANGTVLNIVEWDGLETWNPPAGTTARLTTQADYDSLVETVDQQATRMMPQRTRPLPTVAVGKVVLRNYLEDAIITAQAMEWFSVKIAADTVPQLAKDAVAALALAQYAEAKRLALAWRQAV